MNRIDRAREFRAVGRMAAQNAPDEQAAKFPSMFQKWRAGLILEAGDRVYYEPTGKLYKVKEGQGHTTQADWPPDKTSAMFAVIDAKHAGTLQDPIPAVRGMEYVYGLYYLDPNGKTYLCERSGEPEGGTITLQYLPSDLIGMYFKEVAP